jgi:hypothetical protein
MEYAQADVETSFGTMQATFHEDAVLFRTYGPSDYRHEQTRLRINNVEYHARVDLHRYEGSWGLYRSDPARGPDGYNTHHAINLSRDDWKDASDAARKKVREVLVPELIAFIEANPELLQDGTIKQVERDIERLNHEIDRVSKDLDLLIAQRNALIVKKAEL